ncbi:MAG: hypothetical protein HC796_03020 [Synechococcaceae cyanobacterium RL_1_2]|nr:hypothetical protein [Synechococcaceae cyanobacterium RL_1_2]
MGRSRPIPAPVGPVVTPDLDQDRYDAPAGSRDRPRRRRPRPDFIAPDEEITPVDYQPIEDSDNEGLGEDNNYPPYGDRPDNSNLRLATIRQTHETTLILIIKNIKYY